MLGATKKSASTAKRTGQRLSWMRVDRLPGLGIKRSADQRAKFIAATTMGRFPGVLVLLLLGVLAKGETVNETTKNSPIIYYPTYYPVNQVFVPPAPPPDQVFAAQPQQETFDFIVVGSNSAGAVLANRLTEIGNWRVLLLEAGDVPNPIADVPYSTSSLHFTNYSWNHVYLKQEGFGYGFQDGAVAATRGRVLGGSSVINFMISTRGNSLDYDRWAASGNLGWSYEDVLPYFLRLEDSRLSAQSEQYHGKGGYQTVENPSYFSQSSHVFVQAAQEAGYKYRDYNGRYQKGVSYVQGTLRNGRRCSSEKAYLQPARGRNNLKVITNARATKVLIDPETKTARGVEFSQFRKKYLALASKEVILSAGPLNSPQLLMLSGVGPKDHLAEHGIPLVHDLPVGRKLYDHLAFLGLAFTVNSSSLVMQREQVEDPLALLQFLETGQGPMASMSMIEAIAFARTPASRDPKSYPDVELLFVGGGFHTDRGAICRRAFRISDESYAALFRSIEGAPAFQIIPVLLHPKSSGRVELKSANPFSWPRASGNFLSDPEDVETLLAGIREAQRIAASPAFRKYGARLVANKLPVCGRLVFDSDEYWRCAVRHLSAPPHFDQTSTCKMGPSFDPEAVVDRNLNVHGVKNLRVADPSVIPLPLSGQVSVPATMLGERAADLIKEYWGGFATNG